MKPMTALKNTAVSAKMQLCETTIQNVSRLNRNVKLESPTKRSIVLFSIARVHGVERRIQDEGSDQQDQRQRHQERDRRFALERALKRAALVGAHRRPRPTSLWRQPSHDLMRNAAFRCVDTPGPAARKPISRLSMSCSACLLAAIGRCCAPTATRPPRASRDGREPTGQVRMKPSSSLSVHESTLSIESPRMCRTIILVMRPWV